MVKVKITNYKDKAIVQVGKEKTSISNWRKSIVEPYIKELLKKPKLEEHQAVKLFVIFKTISRVSSMREVDTLFLNIKSMRRETIYYWYSKIIREKSQAVNELRGKILNK